MPPKRKLPSEYSSAEASRPASTPRRSKKSKVVDTDDGGQLSSEKRLARYRSRCPQNILDRVDRVFTQRFFLVDRERNGEELREVFKVLGSTGNVYEVVIDKIPSCSCPDALKGNHCKHLLFVFLKVLNVPADSDLYFQKALLTAELQCVFRDAKPNPTIIAPQSIRDAYGQATGSGSKSTAGEASNEKHKDPEGDDCAICYESMKVKPSELEKLLVWCETCEKAVHKECFAQWRSTARQNGNQLTCVYCRSQWHLEPSGSPTFEGGYLNLGGNTSRDTSSFEQEARQIGWPLPREALSMYIKAWDEFQAAAEALYTKNPEKTRYCVKWRSVEGKLVLKVTDDSTCLKYKTRSSIILNRFDAFTHSLMQKMQNIAPDVSSTSATQQASATTAVVPSSTGNVTTDRSPPVVVAAAAADASATQTSAASAGVKKKKQKKKK